MPVRIAQSVGHLTRRGGGGGGGGGKGGRGGGGGDKAQTSLTWLLANPIPHPTPIPLPVAKFFKFVKPFPAILGTLTLQFIYRQVHILSFDPSCRSALRNQ